MVSSRKTLEPTPRRRWPAGWRCRAVLPLRHGQLNWHMLLHDHSEAGGLHASSRGRGSPSWTRGACLNAPTAENDLRPMTFGHEHRARGLAVVKDPGVRLPNLL